MLASFDQVRADYRRFLTRRSGAEWMASKPGSLDRRRERKGVILAVLFHAWRAIGTYREATVDGPPRSRTLVAVDAIVREG